MLQACMQFRTDDVKTLDYFHQKGLAASVRRTEFEGKSMRYVAAVDTLNKHLPLVVFVHGAPGSSDNYTAYLADAELRQNTQMIAVDRLGYGYSEYGCPETSLAKQAASIQHVIDQYNAEKIILIGHSYGGAIIAKMAMDRPEKILAIIMLAPAIDPDNEKIFWFSHFGRWKLTKWMLNGDLRVAGDEKFSHVRELEKIRMHWKDLKTTVVHIHGQKDKIVPYENLNFSKNHIKAAYLHTINLPNANHFIPWNRFPLVKKEILNICQKTKN